MKQYIWIIVILFWPSISFGQSNTVRPDSSLFTSSFEPHKDGVKHTTYIDFSAMPIRWENFFTVFFTTTTVNYEWEFLKIKNELLSLRLRTGITMLSGILGPPIAVTGLIGRNNSHLDLSLGAFIGIWEIGYGGSLVGWPIAELGYRFQKPEGGFMWKVKAGTTGIGVGAGWAF